MQIYLISLAYIYLRYFTKFFKNTHILPQKLVAASALSANYVNRKHRTCSATTCSTTRGGGQFGSAQFQDAQPLRLTKKA